MLFGSLASTLASAPVREAMVVAAVVSSLVAVVLVRSRGGRPLDVVRARLLFGLPIGTLLTAGCVVAVYLLLQGGLANPRNPLVYPFRAWSYHYPLGVGAAAFTHASQNHLLGNVLGTLVFGSIAEYAWGHYPTGRGVQTFSSWRTNPYARTLAVPVVAALVGLVTAAFAVGPVIGFSGVVFAMAGFALAHRPIGAVLGLIALRISNLVVSALLDPRIVSSPRPRVTTPWWAEVAIQGHAVGLLVGVLLGAALASRRDEWPDPGRVWFGVLAFATVQGLWAVFVPGDGGRYVLFRWVGVVLVFVLATAVAWTLHRTDPDEELVGARPLATVLLVAALVVLALGGVVYNVGAVGHEPPPGPTVDVGDYTVGYAEDVEHGYIAGVSIPYFEDTTGVTTSGVIVTSAERSIWDDPIHASRLANDGAGSVLLGGIGWRTRVHVDRTGWNVAGNGTVFQVYLQPEGRDRTLAFVSDPKRADLTIEDRNVTVRADEGDFEIDVSRDGERLGTAAIPANGSTAEAGGLTFSREERRLYALANGTRSIVARHQN